MFEDPLFLTETQSTEFLTTDEHRSFLAGSQLFRVFRGANLKLPRAWRQRNHTFKRRIPAFIFAMACNQLVVKDAKNPPRPSR